MRTQGNKISIKPVKTAIVKTEFTQKYKKMVILYMMMLYPIVEKYNGNYELEVAGY
jgi:hypothetical protein